MTRTGRIPLIDPSIVVSTLFNYKEIILLANDKILSKTHSIWKQISEELEGKKSSSSLYSFVCDNKHGIRDLLNSREKVKKNDVPSNAIDDKNVESVEDCDNSFNSSFEADNPEIVKHILSMSRKNFNAMTTDKMYKGRKVKKLLPGVWQQKISELLWNYTKMSCGFNYKWHYLNNDLDSGSIHGERLKFANLFNYIYNKI